MSKRKNTETRKVVYEHFKSLTELITTMEKRGPNVALQGRISSQRDESDVKKPWAGTKTYKEATELIRAGYKEPLEKMKKAILKIGNSDNHQRPKMKNDFVGFMPHVPNTLIGLPMTMINKEKQAHKAKTIHLIYSTGASSLVKPDDMMTGGINFISLVNSLEKQGYRVKIDILNNFTTDRTLACFTVNVKEYGQKLNLLKLTFPLVHPGMFRRIGFKWLETTPDLKDKAMAGGYGTPLSFLMNHNLQKESQYLKDHGIIKKDNTFYCSVYTAMHNETPQELAKVIGITK
jgi:hypothetical protein